MRPRPGSASTLVETGASRRGGSRGAPGAASLEARTRSSRPPEPRIARLLAAMRPRRHASARSSTRCPATTSARRVVKRRLQGTCAHTLDDVALDPRRRQRRVHVRRRSVLPGGRGQPAARDRHGRRRSPTCEPGRGRSPRCRRRRRDGASRVRATERGGRGRDRRAGSDRGAAARSRPPCPSDARARPSRRCRWATRRSSRWRPGARPRLDTRQSTERVDVVLGRRTARAADHARCVASFAGSDEAHRTLGPRSRARSGHGSTRSRAMNPDVTVRRRAGDVSRGPTTPTRSAPTRVGSRRRWSVPRRGVFTRPVGRVAFAGEHTAGASPRHDGGRARSGRRAAEQVPSPLDARSAATCSPLLASRPHVRPTETRGIPVSEAAATDRTRAAGRGHRSGPPPDHEPARGAERAEPRPDRRDVRGARARPAPTTTSA